MSATSNSAFFHLNAGGAVVILWLYLALVPSLAAELSSEVDEETSSSSAMALGEGEYIRHHRKV